MNKSNSSEEKELHLYKETEVKVPNSFENNINNKRSG